MQHGSWRGHAVALAVCTGLLVAACGDDRDVAVTGPTATRGIVLLEVELEQLFGAPGRCAIHGTIRNDTGAGQRVVLRFRALNGRNEEIAFAQPTIDFVAAGALATFEARLRDFSDDGFLNDCDRVARVELVEVIL
jgi:hypothetical protein